MAADPVQLFGKPMPVSVEPGADDFVQEVWPLIQGACDLLNAEAARGQLNPTMLKYIHALRGFGIGKNRGFTPCRGTGNLEDGLYVFYVGDEDVKLSRDPLWYASTIIHDGGHAWLDQQDQPATGVFVEQILTQTQIDYYTELGGPASYIQWLKDYMGNPVAINARIEDEA